MLTISAAARPVLVTASVFLIAPMSGIGRKKTDVPMKNIAKLANTAFVPIELAIKLIIGGHIFSDDSAPAAKASRLMRPWHAL